MTFLNCSAAIIAGGKSKRFGSPKYQAEFNGKRLLDLALIVASNISDKILIISGQTELNAVVEYPHYRDIIPGCGPLGGIYTALNNFDSDWLAVLPVDMPLLDAEIYFHLWKQREDQRPVVAKTEKGIESMVSLWHKSNLSFIEERIKTHRWSIYRVLNEMNAVRVNFPPEKQIQFFNINYKKDLELLKTIRKSGGG